MTLRSYLREMTASAHAQIDDLVGVFQDLDGYRNYLTGQLAFREPVEAKIAQADFPVLFGDWRPECKAGLIRADMADLDMHAPDAFAVSSDFTAQLNEPSSLLGTLYVLQGAALGAKVLYRRAAVLGLSEEFGARHLAAQAGDTLSWKRFLAILESCDSINRDAAMRASLDTFEMARRAFAKEVDLQQ
jgi:heme oxygenase